MFPVLFVWGFFTVIVWFFAIGAYIEDDPYVSRREPARAILWAPFWPVVFLVFLLREIPPLAGRVFYDALGPERDIDD